MKAACWSMVFSVGLFSLPLAALAEPGEPTLTMPASTRQSAYDYDHYAGTAAADRTTLEAEKAAPAVEKTAPVPAAAADAAEAVDSSDTPCRWCFKGKLAEPWTLPQPRCLEERKITVGGWLEGGIYGNQWGAPNNGPVGLRNLANQFTADQLWIFAERKTDTKGCGWDVGGRIDYLFGTDGPDTQAFGDRTWDYGWNTSPDYGSAIPQLYAEIAYNDVKVKLGRFYTPIGYEVVQAPLNFFYSHSYSHTFGEPFTHTGGLADYAYNEKVHFFGGWTNGWDEGWEGRDRGSTFLGGLTLALSEKASLAWFCSAGKLGDGAAFPGAATGDLYYNSFVFTYKISEKLTYVFEHDLGANFNVNGQVGVGNQWYEVANYLLYKLNDCWSLGGRIEWFQDPQGARVVAGERGNYFEMSAGVNYKPHANFTIRPELRYDWFDGFAGNVGQPFNDGAASTQLSGGFDMIFTY